MPSQRKTNNPQDIVVPVAYDSGTGQHVQLQSTNGALNVALASSDVNTELPNAAALTDNMSNPTAPAVAAHMMVLDGSTWDRATGNSTNGVDVDVTRVQGVVASKYAAESTASDYSESASTSAEASRVIKASAGRLYSVSVTNANAATRYLMVFNDTSLPTNGTVPIFTPIKVATGDQGSISFFDINGKYCSTGITVAMSSTQNSLTIAGSDHLFYAAYL